MLIYSSSEDIFCLIPVKRMISSANVQSRLLGMNSIDLEVSSIALIIKILTSLSN